MNAGAPAVLLLAACLAAAPLDAQTTRDTTRRTDTLQTVRVTGAREAGVTGGASAVVLRTQALRSSPAPSLEQALRESPFVLVRQNSRGEMELSVRGSDSRQTAVLLDGVPLTLGWDHRTDPSLIPLTGTQTITLVRGLGTLLNGPNTLGGTVEIRHDAGPSDRETRGWAGLGVDHNGSSVLTLGFGAPVARVGSGDLVVRGGIAHRNRPGLSLPSNTTDPTAEDNLRTNSDLREIDGFTMLHWNGAMGRSIGLTFSAFDAERGVPPEEDIQSPRLWRYPYHTRSVTALSMNSGMFHTPFGFGSLELGAGYNSGRLKIESFEDREYREVVAEELGNERTMTGRALFRHSLPRNATIEAAYTIADVRYDETLSPEPLVTYQQRLSSIATEIEAPLGVRTTLNAGVVYDHSTTPLTGGRTPGQEPIGAGGWRVGMTHDIGNDWRLHASASERSRFPALRELYSGALNRFRPNPELRPETLLGFEAGFIVDRSWGPIPDGTVQVTAFHHRLSDAVARITLQNPTRFMRINRDRIESQGLEMLAGFVLGSDPGRAVSITGDALVQHIRLVDTTNVGRHAENNPERRGMLEIGVPLLREVRGYVNARYTGTQYCLNADLGQEMELPSRTVGDVALERSLPVRVGGFFRSLRMLAALDNVANQTVYDQCGLPQPGRTFRVMMTLR